MPSKALALVVLPDEMKMLESDIGGRPAGQYLLESLRLCDEVEINVVVAANTVLPAWCEQYPRLSGNGLIDGDTVDQADRRMLIIDARAWLSHAVLTKMLLQARQMIAGFRVIESWASTRPAHRDAKTLAVFLPPGRERSDLLYLRRMIARRGLEQLLDAELVADESVLDASDVDASEPALLLDSFAALAAIEQHLLHERAMSMLSKGVRIRDPNNVHIRGELMCGADVDIEINVIIEGTVVLGNGVRIGAHSIVRHSRIGENTCIKPFSFVEHSIVGADSVVGPYGRIRPGSTIGDGVQIGNYVEIKTSQIGAGSRINHHSFIGDAVLADHVTIGAGTITCNHDGTATNQTIIERGAYVGSGCNLVAPLRIGAGATVGAGSTITRDVPAAKLTLARMRQQTIEGWQGPKKR